MSEKKARLKRAKQASSAEPPKQSVEQPGSVPTATIADLLQLLGVKDVEIMGLQRQVAGLQQQVQMLAEQLGKKEKEKEKGPK